LIEKVRWEKCKSKGNKMVIGGFCIKRHQLKNNNMDEGDTKNDDRFSSKSDPGRSKERLRDTAALFGTNPG